MDEELRDVRLPLMVSRSEAQAIDGWRYSNHVPTRAEAIRRLIELGLSASATPAIASVPPFMPEHLASGMHVAGAMSGTEAPTEKPAGKAQHK